MKITINSPSYKRPKAVDTLKYMPFCKVWVCEMEADAYREANPGAEIVAVPKGVQGNVSRIRNYILDQEYAAGVEAVVIVDDDLQHLGYHEKTIRNQIPTDNIMWFIEKHTLMAEEIGARLWGVNTNFDKQSYCEMTPFSMLSFIGGPFGVHVRSDIRYDERLPLKEDYDLFLQHVNKYRRVFRANKYWYAVKQGGSGKGQAGGCATYRNLIREQEQMTLLQKKWGKKIIKMDNAPNRGHHLTKKKNFDINPVVRVPIRGL